MNTLFNDENFKPMLRCVACVWSVELDFEADVLYTTTHAGCDGSPVWSCFNPIGRLTEITLTLVTITQMKHKDVFSVKEGFNFHFQ